MAPVPIENRLMTHPRLEAVCVTGVGQPATFALAMLDEATHARLAAGGDAALRQQIEAELAALLGQANAQLEAHERLQFVAIVSETWTIAQGFLTPTMKIKRSVIEAQYQAQFEDWFSKGATVIWSA